MKHYGELSYGPLFSYEKGAGVRVSFGIKMSLEKSWPAGDQGKVTFQQGLNRIIGPWNDQVAALFQKIKSMRRFQNETLPNLNFGVGKPGVYRVGFGSCLREDLDPKQKIFNRIRKLKPHAFMLIGDTVYNDLPSGWMDRPFELAAKYNRQLQVRRFQDFYSKVPIYAVWDDHDFWKNNASREDVASKDLKLSRKLFTAIFPNPAYGGQGEGIYFKWALGDIDFFMLDTRWFRKKSKKRMLGDPQTTWLQTKLLESQATFKVLVSSVQWHEKGGRDSWSDYLSERNELFQFIFENKIKGILLLSGDAHYGAAYQLSPQLSTAGYLLTEFTSSALAVKPKKKSLIKTKEITQLLAARKKHNFGMLEFNTTDAQPYVDLKLYIPDNPAIWENGQPFHRVYAQDLQFAAIKKLIPENPASQISADPPEIPAATIPVKPVNEQRQTHLTTSPQECPQAPIFTLEKLRKKGLSQVQIEQVCHGK